MPLVSSHWFQFCLLGPYSKSWITFLPNNHSNMWHKIDHILLSPYYLQAEHPKLFRLKKDCNSPVQNLSGVLFFFCYYCFSKYKFYLFLIWKRTKGLLSELLWRFLGHMEFLFVWSLIFIFIFWQHSMCNLSSATRDRTCASYSRSTESSLLDCQGSPSFLCFWFTILADASNTSWVLDMLAVLRC